MACLGLKVTNVPRYFYLTLANCSGDYRFFKAKKRRHFPEPVLNQSISLLDVSEESKEITRRYGYNAVADILSLPTPYKLLEHQGFGYRMLVEYVSFLEDQ
ncbi:MAG: hypothetical protein ABS46_18815 [Cytophagaceae bacterium SCN 52-12]|nr:MAG: hypothetical protein ABS46_18815 [Cytophagaceae bacterium SCN 52-12]